MDQNVELTASDGHRLSAYQSESSGAPRGGIVVIQEIFGVTRHIRAVTDQYAAAGFNAIAPALFDRLERNIDVPYTDVAKGRGYMQASTAELVMQDLQAAIEHVRADGKIGVVGFCWGGTMAYLAAARLRIDAAVSYYGGGIDRYKAEKPRCPILFHFGEKDTHIPMSAIDEMKVAVPDGQFHLYPAEHGFNCTDRASFDAGSAALAFERSIDFLHRNLGGRVS